MRIQILAMVAWSLAACSPQRAEGVDINSKWSVAQGKFNGSALFLRINRGVASLMADPRYKDRVGVAVPLVHPSAEGLPGEAELKELSEIETALGEELESDSSSLPVLVITTNGMREFVYYTADPATFEPAVQRVRRSIKHHQLESYMQPDPDWSVYREFSNEFR